MIQSLLILHDALCVGCNFGGVFRSFSPESSDDGEVFWGNSVMQNNGDERTKANNVIDCAYLKRIMGCDLGVRLNIFENELRIRIDV